MCTLHCISKSFKCLTLKNEAHLRPTNYCYKESFTNSILISKPLLTATNVLSTCLLKHPQTHSHNPPSPNKKGKKKKLIKSIKQKLPHACLDIDDRKKPKGRGKRKEESNHTAKNMCYDSSSNHSSVHSSVLGF